MYDRLVQKIRARTRTAWVNDTRAMLTEWRIWVQENGEKAAVLSLIAGVLLVTAFRLIFILFIISLLVAAVVWFIAEPDGQGKTD